MDTSDIIQSEMIQELDQMQSKFESYYIKNLDLSITEEARDYRLKLEKYGFKGNKIIKDHSRISKNKKRLEKVNEIALAIKLYKDKFPLYRVIPLQVMISISEKYNLFFSNGEHFIGDIPLKNLDDLEKFMEFGRRTKIPFEQSKILEILSKSFVDIKNRCIKLSEGNVNNLSALEFFVTAPRDQFSSHPSILEIGKFLIKNNGQETAKYKEIYNELRRPKDPIIWVPVSFPMPGGACMIISKWGEEAKYPEFTNPIDN